MKKKLNKSMASALADKMHEEYMKNWRKSKDEMLEDLTGMAERYKMWAITREAFVLYLENYLEKNQIIARYSLSPSRQLGPALLSTIPGGCEVDVESCRTLLDQDFANKAVEKAIELVNECY